MGVERIQEEARTTKDKLDGHRETQPEKHGHQLHGKKPNDVNVWPMLPTGRGMNIFLKLLFENTLHNDEWWGHILSVQFLPVLSITYFVIGQIQKFFEV